MSVEIELLTVSHLLGRLQLVDAAVGVLEREERGHGLLIDTLAPKPEGHGAIVANGVVGG